MGHYWSMALTPRERIAKNTAYYRKQKNFHMEELSLLIGADNSYISKLEKGRINITIDKLEKLAKVFGIDICELLKL